MHMLVQCHVTFSVGQRPPDETHSKIKGKSFDVLTLFSDNSYALLVLLLVLVDLSWISREQ